MTYERHLLQSPPVGAPKGTPWTDVYELYDQPLRNRLHYLAYKAWWYASWKIKPLSKIIDIADKYYEYKHKKTCTGDCATATSRASGETTKVCARLPLDCAMDCKLDYLHRKNNNNTRRL